jgi:hypothetical protein
VEIGDIYGPYTWRGDGIPRKPFWVWSARDYDALDVFAMLTPWLSKRRLDRALELTGIDFRHVPFWRGNADF